MTTITPNTKKIEQTSEHVWDPIQVPIVLNNEIYLIIQQDVRKITDTRYLTFKRITNDGQIEDIPNILQGTDGNIIDLLNFSSQCTQQNNMMPDLNQTCSSKSIPKDYSKIPIEKRLYWILSGQTPVPEPLFKYSKRTSTSDLKNSRNKYYTNQNKNVNDCHCCKCNRKTVLSKCKAVNTKLGESYRDTDDSSIDCDDDFKEENAREKLKKRKVHFLF